MSEVEEVDEEEDEEEDEEDCDRIIFGAFNLGPGGFFAAFVRSS